MIQKTLCISACMMLLAACGGGATSPVPNPNVLPPGSVLPGASASAHVVISVPSRSASNAAKRPAYVSPSTQSVTVAVDSSAAVTQNLSLTSPNCTSSGANYPLNCTVTVTASAGVHTLTFATFDQQNAAGNPLSTNSIATTFVAGQNPAIPVVLAGIAKGIQVLPAPGSKMIIANNTLTSPPGLQWVWGVTQTLVIAAFDADGNYIVGPGAPALSVSVGTTIGTPGITLATASNNNPNKFSLQSTGAGYATLSVTATPTVALAGSPLVVTLSLASVAGSSPLLADPTGQLFSTGRGITYDSNGGNLYVYDMLNAYLNSAQTQCQILRVTPSGSQSLVAGGSCTGSPYADGTGVAAQLGYAWSSVNLAYDSTDNNVYMADTYNCAIRRISPSGVVTTIAGAPPPTNACAFADGTGGAARFNAPHGIAYDPNTDALYVTDGLNCAIRKVTTTGVVTTIAGSTAPNPSCGFTDGIGNAAQFGYNPQGIVFDSSDGNLYVADAGSCAIRAVTTAGTVATVAGAAPPGACGFVDGSGTVPRFLQLVGIAFDSDNGQLYVSDGCVIRQVSTTGSVVTITGNPPPKRAGSCLSGPSSNSGAGPVPFTAIGSGITLGAASGIAYDHATGFLYATDSNGIWQLQL